MIDDDDVGRADLFFGALIKAVVGMAMFRGASGAIGANPFPDVVGGEGGELFEEAGLGGSAPFGNFFEGRLFV